MELWLLGGGAIVLIAITMWIVWPVQPADGGATVLDEPDEPPALAPSPAGLLGDRFENRYVSVAAPVALPKPAQVWAPAHTTAPHLAITPTSGDPWARSLAENRSLPQSKTIGIGAAALIVLSGAAGGAWIYARWQRERNKPLNRLRRGARGLGPALIVGGSAVIVAWRLLRSLASSGD